MQAISLAAQPGSKCTRPTSQIDVVWAGVSE